MDRLSFHVLVVGLWLVAWANGTGVLIRSTIESHGRDIRVCRYVVGPSVRRVPIGDARRAHTCPFIVQLALASSRSVLLRQGSIQTHPPRKEILPMKRFALPAVLVGLWLYAWASDTGVLVLSSAERYGNSREYRVCHYLIGLSVQRVERGETWRTRRCPLLARVY